MLFSAKRKEPFPPTPFLDLVIKCLLEITGPGCGLFTVSISVSGGVSALQTLAQ